MSIEKLTIRYETGKDDSSLQGVVQALFNPSQLRYSWNATWSPFRSAVKEKGIEAGTTAFQGAGPQTLALALFFDTYAPYGGEAAGGVLERAKSFSASAQSSALGLASGKAERPKSVTDLTKEVLKLTENVSGLDRPPRCKLSWGMNAELFEGVLQSATLTYTLFWRDGTPVRATMDCTFLEVKAKAKLIAQKELDQAGIAKTYQVKAGDTLMGIAERELGDASRWREISNANGGVTRDLPAGLTLAIPKAR